MGVGLQLYSEVAFKGRTKSPFLEKNFFDIFLESALEGPIFKKNTTRTQPRATRASNRSQKWSHTASYKQRALLPRSSY